MVSNPVFRRFESRYKIGKTQARTSVGAHIGMLTGLCMLSFWISDWVNLRKVSEQFTVQKMVFEVGFEPTPPKRLVP